MPLTTKALGRTDVGRIRRRNEDAFEVDGERGIAIVADGMGGHPAGNVASALAAEEAVRRLRELSDRLASGEVSAGELGDVMAEAVRGADERVRQEGKDHPEREGMGTTLTAILVERASSRAVIGHVGDSRAYRLRDGSLERLTKDHTWVQEQVDAGRLTPQQARGHPYSSILTQGVGLERPAEPDVREVEASPGDLFMVCSDGLVGMLTDGRIQTILSDELPRGGLEGAAEALVEAANREGGLDNVTVALLEVGRDG